MDEKILIKGELDIDLKRALLAFIGCFFGVSAILFLILCFPHKYEYSIGSYWSSSHRTEIRWETGWESAFGYGGAYLMIFIMACTFALLGIITLLTFFALSKCKISITEYNVKGNTYFGKEVILPLYMVSAYSTQKLFSTITVSTASGVTKFPLIKNYVEIGNVLSKKINTRQGSTSTTANEPSQSNQMTNDLIKLKQLLDMGVITQEEFDTKKKQILGL